MTESERLAALERDGVRIVRVTYPDLHGVLRGKDVPIGVFAANVLDDGLGFCKAISTVDLQHNVVAGFEHGFRDIHVWPLPETLVRLPWAPEVAWCLADQTADGEPYGADPRATLKRAMAAFGELGLEPVMGPELEFYLLERSETASTGWTRYVENPTHVYTVGDHADPRGILDRMLLSLHDAQLGVIGAAHEYGMSQWEINLMHSNALDAADRAFRFKAAVKDLATRDGMLATFMGKPFNGDAGLGLPPAPLALRRGWCQRLRRRGRRGGLRRPPAPLHRGRHRPRTGPDGDPQPDRQRLPAHRPPRARPDARLLGLRQPLRPRARAARARRRDARRDATG